MPLGAQRLGHASGGRKLESVSLAIVDRQGIERKALLLGDGGRRGGIQPTR
jgi:hypothetical protein